MRRIRQWLLHRRSTCPYCGFAAYWQATEPGTCDGCGYPTTHLEG
jgi:uncharacterized protein (DUF427 family)